MSKYDTSGADRSMRQGAAVDAPQMKPSQVETIAQAIKRESMGLITLVSAMSIAQNISEVATLCNSKNQIELKNTIIASLPSAIGKPEVLANAVLPVVNQELAKLSAPAVAAPKQDITVTAKVTVQPLKL